MPFLDKEILDTTMLLDPEFKMCKVCKKVCEYGVLHEVFHQLLKLYNTCLTLEFTNL